MIKLNDQNLIVGQIKQMLKEFNLPTCPVNPPEELKIDNTFFIQDSKIYNRVSGKDLYVCEYVFGNFYRNLTKNLRIDNLLYDNYTHEYLGKYLHFLKRYLDIDLLSLYNMFDYKFLDQDIYTYDISGNLVKRFDKESKILNYYQIPVRLKTKYTLFCDSYFPIEYALCVKNKANTGKKQNDIQTLLYDKTFAKLSATGKKLLEFNLDNTSIEKIKNYQEDIYLVIGLKKNQDIKTVLLEGDYTHPTKSGFPYIADGKKMYSGNFENPILFSHLAKAKDLLSDTIIQYLTHNTIFALSENYDIEKYQKCMAQYENSIWPKHLKRNEFKYYKDPNSLWNGSFDEKVFIKKYIEKNNIVNENNYDVLPYIDKKLENSFNNNRDKTGGII